MHAADRALAAKRSEVHDIVRGQTEDVGDVKRGRAVITQDHIEAKAGTRASGEKFGLSDEGRPREAHTPRPTDRKDDRAGKKRTWVNDMRTKLIQREAVDAKKLDDAKRRPTHEGTKMLRKKKLVEPTPSVALGDEDTSRGRGLKV